LDQAVATVVATRSRDETESAMLAFTADDQLRLRKVSWYYASRHAIEAEDLLQEAIARALDGSRKCPVNVSVVKFLAEAMRSIAHGETEKLENQVVTISLIKSDGPEDDALDLSDPSPSIEDKMIEEENAANFHDSILSLFEEGTPARDMVGGMMDDWSAEELREVMGLDKTAYASMRKLIRRRLNKAYPRGWSHDRK
jgi:DNA-directed RNA polymerase specialized sigma24 family protein